MIRQCRRTFFRKMKNWLALLIREEQEQEPAHSREGVKTVSFHARRRGKIALMPCKNAVHRVLLKAAGRKRWKRGRGEIKVQRLFVTNVVAQIPCEMRVVGIGKGVLHIVDQLPQPIEIQGVGQAVAETAAQLFHDGTGEREIMALGSTCAQAAPQIGGEIIIWLYTAKEECRAAEKRNMRQIRCGQDVR